jgi:hypothetical protein
MSVPLLRADSLLRAGGHALQRAHSTAGAADNASVRKAVQERVDDIQAELGGFSGKNLSEFTGNSVLTALASVGASACAPPSAVVSHNSLCPQAVTDLRAAVSKNPAFGAFPEPPGQNLVSAAVRAALASLPTSAAAVLESVLSEVSSAESTVICAARDASVNSMKASNPLHAQLSALVLLCRELSQDSGCLVPAADLSHLYRLAVPLSDMLAAEAFDSARPLEQLVAGQISLVASAGTVDIDQAKLRVSNLRDRFVTIAAVGAPVTHGKWYFEVTLESSDICQVCKTQCSQAAYPVIYAITAGWVGSL